CCRARPISAAATSAPRPRGASVGRTPTSWARCARAPTPRARSAKPTSAALGASPRTCRTDQPDPLHRQALRLGNQPQLLRRPLLFPQPRPLPHPRLVRDPRGRPLRRPCESAIAQPLQLRPQQPGLRHRPRRPLVLIRMGHHMFESGSEEIAGERRPCRHSKNGELHRQPRERAKPVRREMRGKLPPSPRGRRANDNPRAPDRSKGQRTVSSPERGHRSRAQPDIRNAERLHAESRRHRRLPGRRRPQQIRAHGNLRRAAMGFRYATIKLFTTTRLRRRSGHLPVSPLKDLMTKAFPILQITAGALLVGAFLACAQQNQRTSAPSQFVRAFYDRYLELVQAPAKTPPWGRAISLDS